MAFEHSNAIGGALCHWQAINADNSPHTNSEYKNNAPYRIQESLLRQSLTHH